MLCYRTEQYDATHTIHIWTIKTHGHETFVSALHVNDFLNIGMPAIIEKVSKNHLRHWGSVTQCIPPENVFTAESVFVNRAGLYGLVPLVVDMEKFNWMMETVFEGTESTTNQALRGDDMREMADVFDKLYDLLTDTTRGKGVQIQQQKFLQIWTALVVIGTRHEWVKNFVKDLTTLKYEESYTIFEHYRHKLEALRSNLLLLKLLMYTYGSITLSPDDVDLRKELAPHYVQIINFRQPDANPFYAVTQKHLLKIKSARGKKNSEREISRRKFEACKMLTAYNSSGATLPEFKKLLKFGDESSLNETNAGENFIEMFDSITNQSLFFLELANREICKCVDTYAIFSID